MESNKLTPEQKLEQLSEKLEVLEQGTALIERFQRATKQWLKEMKAKQTE